MKIFQFPHFTQLFEALSKMKKQQQQNYLFVFPFESGFKCISISGDIRRPVILNIYIVGPRRHAWAHTQVETAASEYEMHISMIRAEVFRNIFLWVCESGCSCGGWTLPELEWKLDNRPRMPSSSNCATMEISMCRAKAALDANPIQLCHRTSKQLECSIWTFSLACFVTCCFVSTGLPHTDRARVVWANMNY